MKNLIYLIFLLPISIVGQLTSDSIQSEVKTFVTDSSANNYWKKVYITRDGYTKEDYTKEELRLFYYSQGFKNVKWAPFPTLSLFEDRIKMIQAANSNKCKKVLKIAAELVEKNPFDLTTLIYYSMCLNKMNHDINNIYYSRMRMIVESILNTGDGTSSSTAIKISNIGDDGLLIGFLDFKGKRIGDQTIDGKVYSVWEDSQGNKLYFEYVFVFL